MFKRVWLFFWVQAVMSTLLLKLYLIGYIQVNHTRTCMSWMMVLNCTDRSVHCLSRSMALSKFFTYSAYILRKGASCAKMSPMRGVESLQEDADVSGWVWDLRRSVKMKRRSPLAHPRLQIWQEELAVEGVDGSHIGEDALHHLDRKRPLPSLLWEFSAEHLQKHS